MSNPHLETEPVVLGPDSGRLAVLVHGRGSGPEAMALWKQAWEHLAQARESGASEDDRPRMRAFRGEAGLQPVGARPAVAEHDLVR